MGSIVSLHIFLEEHFHPALHGATGNVCATLTSGWTFMVGVTIFALGSAIYYIASFSPNEGVFDRSVSWPSHVSCRIRSTYIYYTSSLVIAAVSMATVTQFPTAMAFLSKYSLATIVWSVVAMMLTGDIVRAIPYSETIGLKEFAFVIHSATIGAIFAPICMLGSPVMIQAGWITGGVVGLASSLAFFAPPYWILGISVPLSFCYLVTFISSIIGAFWATSTSMGAHAYALNLYVGLVAVAGFHMFYSHFFCLVAERIPAVNDMQYDPISASILIFRYSLDVFVRIAILLVGGGNGVFKHVCTFPLSIFVNKTV